MSWPFQSEPKAQISVDFLSLVCRVDNLQKRVDQQDHEIAKLNDRISNLNMALAFKSGKKPSEAAR